MQLKTEDCPECQQILDAADRRVINARLELNNDPDNCELKTKLIEAYKDYAKILEGYITGSLQCAIKPK